VDRTEAPPGGDKDGSKSRPLRPMGQTRIADPNFFPVSESQAAMMQMYSQWWWDTYLKYYQSGEILRQTIISAHVTLQFLWPPYLRWWERQASPKHPNPHVHVLNQINQMKSVMMQWPKNRTLPNSKEMKSNETSSSPSILKGKV